MINKIEKGNKIEYFKTKSQIFRTLALNEQNLEKKAKYEQICFSYLRISNYLYNIYNELKNISNIKVSDNLEFPIEEIMIITPEEEQLKGTRK